MPPLRTPAVSVSIRYHTELWTTVAVDVLHADPLTALGVSAVADVMSMMQV